LSVDAELSAGSELLGYRVEAVLGRGGMGIVYLAEDLRLKRRVALKLLSPELAEDDRFQQRLLAESELAASLDHPNIVPIYQAGEAEGRIFISMRYVEGEDLKRVLRKGRLSPQYSLTLISQIANALDEAHARGLVHRDVKPSNVLIAPAAGHEGADHVYLADFGLTRRLSEQELSAEQGQLMGTVDYVAPEQIRGEAVNGRADVYSLGCLFFECLAGEPPFRHKSDVALLVAHLREEPPSLSALRPDLPPQIDSVIAKALAKEPDLRYQTCRQLVEAAREALPAPGVTPRRRIRRRQLVASALVAAAAGLAAGLVLTWGAGASSARISIGIVAAKTGVASIWDLPAGQAFMLRIGEINKAGGLLGKKIDVDWVDDRSGGEVGGGTKPVKFEVSPTASELISKGAVAIVADCIFHWARPALAASRDRNVPALSLCGETFRAASPAVVGPYAGAMVGGADSEGASVAEWLRKHRPQWKRAYVLKDTSGEYSKQAAEYFLVRWLDLSGSISGEDRFVAPGYSLPLGAQLARLRAKLRQTDLIYLATDRDGAAAILQIRGAGIDLPIATTSRVEGIPLGAAAGNPSNVFALGAACLPSYCRGATPQVGRFFANFKKRYGTVPSSDAVRGYDLATVLAAAIRTANSTEGPKIAQALFSGLTIETLTGRVKFSEQCHRPQPPRFILERYTNGRATALGTVYAQNIPNIGDGNPCAGAQARPLQ
jgi:ABC-type branched-subunit amino acid transport system substrate-binding protein/tRNA A-37 threonylcarbamoyl transferase component Bud32